MKRSYLESLGLEKDVVEEIMKEHGKTVQTLKAEGEGDSKETIHSLEQQIVVLQNKIAEDDKKYSTFEEEKAGLVKKVNTYESNEMKIRVAREHGIPFDLASRLRGDTEEELTQDAKSLSTLVSKKEILPLKNVDTETKDDGYKQVIDGLIK